MNKTENQKLKPQLDSNPNPTPQSDTARVEEAGTQVIAAADSLGPILTEPLTVKQSRELPRARNGGLPVVPQLVNLTITRPSLVPNGTSPEAMLSALDLVARLKSLLSSVRGLQKHLEDTVRVREAQLWRDALDIYASASRRSGDAEVNDVVQRMKAALALGPRSPRFLRTPLPKPKHVVIPAPTPTVTFSSAEDHGGAAAGSQAQSSTPSTAGTGAGLNGSSAPISSANGATPVSGG